jgi:hypothetical protein
VRQRVCFRRPTSRSVASCFSRSTRAADRASLSELVRWYVTASRMLKKANVRLSARTVDARVEPEKVLAYIRTPATPDRANANADRDESCNR